MFTVCMQIIFLGEGHLTVKFYTMVGQQITILAQCKGNLSRPVLKIQLSGGRMLKFKLNGALS